MNKSKLNKFVYILLRERLTFGDMDAIITEVEQEGNGWQIPLVHSYAEEIVNRLTASGLKCHDNMCNTQDDDVRMVSVPVDSGNENISLPMCADCRKRNPEAVLL
jgi:hypothetical protein